MHYGHVCLFYFWLLSPVFGESPLVLRATLFGPNFEVSIWSPPEMIWNGINHWTSKELTKFDGYSMNIIEGERLYGPPSPPYTCTRLSLLFMVLMFISYLISSHNYPLRSMAMKSDLIFPYNLSSSMIFMEYPSNFVSSLLVQWFILILYTEYGCTYMNNLTERFLHKWK